MAATITVTASYTTPGGTTPFAPSEAARLAMRGRIFMSRGRTASNESAVTTKTCRFVLNF